MFGVGVIELSLAMVVLTAVVLAVVIFLVLRSR